jgi:hypothetical protein
MSIPYENGRLPGYFFHAGKGRRPTLLVHSGFDGTMEGIAAQITCPTGAILLLNQRVFDSEEGCIPRSCGLSTTDYGVCDPSYNQFP